MHGRGACMAGSWGMVGEEEGACMAGMCVAGGMHGRACMAGGMHGRGCMAGGMHGRGAGRRDGH